MALRGVFSHVFSKSKPFELVPEQIVKAPKLNDAAVTQFVIDDGWVGIALGPQVRGRHYGPPTALGNTISNRKAATRPFRLRFVITRPLHKQVL